jgi:hypothetical protein
MTFKITVVNDDLPETVRKSPKAIEVAIEEVAWEMRRNIRGTSPQKTGTLKGSWSKKKIGDLKYNIFTTVKYARWVNDGTGIYGSGKPITPKRAKFLRFEWHGRIVFARSVRGQKGQHYVPEAIRRTEARTETVVVSKLRKAGLL